MIFVSEREGELKMINSFKGDAAENRAFGEMLLAARKMLDGKNPAELAARAGCTYNGETQSFTMACLGKNVEIYLPEYNTVPETDGWMHLIMLHYLARSDGAPVSEELMAFGGCTGGLIRGTKFDLTAEGQLSEMLSGRTAEQIKAALEAVGGRIVPGRGDIGAQIPFLPRYPVTVNIWLADEEFPASGKMLLSKSADHYLTVEDAVTAGEIIIRRIYDELEKQAGGEK